MELSVYSQDGTITLYFLLPENCKPEDCSKLLKYAYQACREHDLGPVWLSSKECLNMIPTKQDVFVCDPFKGNAYDYLLSGGLKCVRVLGPRCLLTCLHSKKPVPELPSPLHNMAMHDIIVTSTGFEKEEKNHLLQMVEKMCGIYSNCFHEGITHLIARAVGTKKYLVAVEKEIPIMTEEWVQAVWKASNEESDENVSATQEQFIKFTCPVFRGLVICVSQLPRKEKDALRTLIENNGGTYTANLEMSTTSVLITPSSEGEKYKHATQWRIPCLTQDWIHDSVENGFALPWDEYKLQKKPKSSTPTNDQSIKGPPDVSICSTILNESSMNGTTNINETVEQDYSVLLRKSTDSRLLAGISALEDLDIQKVFKAGLFLDGCKIFASGFEPNMNEKLRRIFNAGGATRFNNLTDAVTHVIIGKHIDEHLNAIHSWNVKPQVVTACWLVECVNQGRAIDDDKFSYLKTESAHKNVFPSPMTSVNKNTPKTTVQPVDENNEKTLIDEELMKQYLTNVNAEMTRRNSVSEKSVDCSTLPDSQESTSGGIFKGQVFTVSGYSEEIEEQLIELICDNGGEVVEATSSRTVDYSIVSVEGEGIFHHKALNYITHIYLEDCLEQEALLPVDYFHLPFEWPPYFTPLSGCVIATSVYKGKERPFITHLATKMGAVYQDMFARKDNPNKGVKCSTHLLCPSPEGGKYAAAQKWGVPAITKDWLLKCADKGIKVSEEPFTVEKSPEVVDCKGVLISLLKKSGKLSKDCLVVSSSSCNDSMVAPSPFNRKVRAVKNQHGNEMAMIQTPDAETIRKMYPTPGCPSANDSLDAMPTPETPYGSTWYSNPPSRIRKGLKRALDALPDNMITKRPFVSPGTPDEVYFKRFSEKLKEIVANHPVPKPPSGERMIPVEPKEGMAREERDYGNKTQPECPADHHGPLTGVIVYASRKLCDSHQALYRTVAELGGDYRWTYDSSVTHFLHYGRMNDTNKEFRLAREEKKMIVAPDWVWMCRDEGRRIDEGLFPHVHNPKLSLSIISTKSTPARKKRGRGRKTKGVIRESQDGEEEEEEVEAEEEEESSPTSPTKEALAKQLEELETLALVTGGAQRRTPNTSVRKSLPGGELKSTPTRTPSTQQRATANTESESQGTAITWDDPQEREARARLEVALVGDTQDIIAQKQEKTEKGNKENDLTERKDSDSSDLLHSSLPSTNCVFALSGMNDEEREMYSDMIICLGGSVVDSKNFDPSITHIVTIKPNRSEKHLAAIASGKWIVYKTFLESSRDAGRLVNEEPHEWGNEEAVSLPTLTKDSIEDKLASAAHRWRLRLNETGKGAFHGMKVVFYSSRERVAAFTRLIEAGGGQVIRNPKDEIDEVTHCFVEINKSSKVDLALFASRQIPCIPPMYLNELLITYPPPDEMESCISEYKDIIANMT